MITVGNKKRGARGEYVGRGSPLGNPYVVGKDGTRAECIAKYKVWFAKARQTNKLVQNELERLHTLAEEGDLTLVCWCKPLACHADVIATYLGG